MIPAWTVRVATPADVPAWAAMRAALWPDASAGDHGGETRTFLGEPRMQAWLAWDGSEAVGFAEACLRQDYVNGTASSPVAFLEGLYVKPSWRRRGAGAALVAAAEEWGRRCGCLEFASDALIDNAVSHAAHRAYGFEETERVVYFRKRL